MNASDIVLMYLPFTPHSYICNAIETYSLAVRQKCNLGIVRDILGSRKRRRVSEYFILSRRKCAVVLVMHEGGAFICGRCRKVHLITQPK